jgi:hypothetical protein
MVYNSNNDICFNKGDFKLYIFLLVCVILFLLYILNKKREEMMNVDLFSHLSQKELIDKITSLQESVFKITLEKQNCERNLQEIKRESETNIDLGTLGNIQNRLLNKIYNPIASPLNIYRDKYDSYNIYQRVGFITNTNDGQFPVFGREKYPNKSDKMEYYTINEGRNSVKIPFKTKNNEELFDGDSILISELSNNPFIFKKYETEGLRYNPNL